MSTVERERLKPIVDRIKERFPGAILGEEDSYGDLVVVADRGKAHDVLRELRDVGFNMLLDIAGVDLLGVEHTDRYMLVYNLYSIPADLRLRLKVFVPENDMNVSSVCDVWQAANWAEREAYDMFGFHFEGHPNLERILCHREFVGHALRRDYPVMKGQWATGTSDLMPDLERE
jgi:NADH-quinone oxidoreductase subunit C